MMRNPQFADRHRLPLILGWMAVLGCAAAIAVPARRPVAMDLGSADTRQTTVAALAERSQSRKQEALARAREQGWATRGITPDGRIFELMELDVFGRPMYYITMNVEAAIATATDHVRNTAPFYLSGTNLIVGVWDEGAVRADHQEFVAPDRVVVKDGSGNHKHATHVGGTLGAKGHDADAIGMAPAVTIHSYDWDDDLAEMTAEAATEAGLSTHIYISNHSYGYLTGWTSGNWSGNSGWHWFGKALSDREDRGFGQYSSHARDWDDLCYHAPYFLPFKAAGNNRNDGPPDEEETFYYKNKGGQWTHKEYDPLNDPFADGHREGGYNTISYNGVAKNIMTVGAVTDAVFAGQRDPGAASMSAFSGWGPADDGRIKPDIVAHGVGLYSTQSDSTSSYGYKSGTSMATPNAAGSALLLVEFYQNLFPEQSMRAATLKGLIIHTADDLGTPGPNYVYGWGLMNTKAAADHIQAHYDDPEAFFIIEGVLDTNTPIQTYSFVWDGSNAVRATLAWTDPPGTAQTGLNVTNSVLVNDLDLRIICPMGMTNYPYVLDFNNFTNAATFGDNTIDNVEQVFMASPDHAGNYTIHVSHKGSLSDGEQHYGLILSGAAGTTETVLVTFDAQGGTTPDPETRQVTFGAAYGTLATTSREGYSFAGWWTGVGGTGSEVRSETVVTIASDHTLYAHWTISEHTLSVESAHGEPDPAVGIHTNLYGTVLTNSVDALVTLGGTQYVSVGWTLTGHEPAAGTTNEFSMTVTNDAVLTWQWATNYWLEPLAGANGSVDASNQWVSAGGDVIITATPDAHHHFVEWIGDIDGCPIDGNAITAVMDRSRRIEANFAIDTYTLTYLAGPGGTIDGETPQTVDHGESGTTVTAVSDAGYHFTQWSDGLTDNSRQDTNVTNDLTVTASFALDPHTLTVISTHGDPDPGAGIHTNLYGTVLTNSVDALVTLGGTQHVSVGWTLTGHEPSAGTTNNFSMTVTNDAALTWQWTTNYWLEPVAGANGSVDTSNQWVAAGGDIVITATPDAHHHFVEWTGDTDGCPIDGNEITAVMDQARRIEALFAIDNYTLSYYAGPGGTIDGETPQTVDHGENGTAVTAVGEAGAAFDRWSDGSAENPRVDGPISSNIQVTARFKTDPADGGAGTPIGWFVLHELMPDEDEDWVDLDHVDTDGDGMPNWQEYIADTDPTNAASVLRVDALQTVPEGILVRWRGGVGARQILERSQDPTRPDAWHSVYTNQPPTDIEVEYLDPHPEDGKPRFYRIRVERP